MERIDQLKEIPLATIDHIEDQPTNRKAILH
jgi:hypothetical protein